jgi:hypothetical protein
MELPDHIENPAGVVKTFAGCEFIGLNIEEVRIDQHTMLYHVVCEQNIVIIIEGERYPSHNIGKVYVPLYIWNAMTTVPNNE